MRNAARMCDWGKPGPGHRGRRSEGQGEVGNDMEQRIRALRASGQRYKVNGKRNGVATSNIPRMLKGAENMPKSPPLNPSSPVPTHALLLRAISACLLNPNF